MKQRLWLVLNLLFMFLISSPLVAKSAPSCESLFSGTPAAIAADEGAWAQAFNNLVSNSKISDTDLNPFAYIDPSTPQRPVLEDGPASEELITALSSPVVLRIDQAYRFGGGAVVLGNNVFANQSFNRFHANSIPQDRSPEILKKWWAHVIKTQPWIEWKSSTQTMQLHKTGAQERILSSLPKTSLILYRGTTLFEASALDLIHALEQGPMTADLLSQKIDTLSKSHQSLVKYYEEKNSDESRVKKLNALKDFKSLLDQWIQTGNETSPKIAAANLKNFLQRFMNEGAFGGIFTTSDPARAELFSKGAIISFEIKTEDLWKLNATKSMYVGVEDNIEIAFLFDAGFATLSNGYKSWTPKDSSKMWN